MNSPLTLGVALLALQLSSLAASDQPDLFIFLTDDQSQLDASPYGEKVIRTPHMQKLAEAGMTFDRAYVASPSCAPSRAALLTGLMPARNGAESNHSRPDAKLKKWPAYFQELGYEVVAFGKVAHYKHTSDYGFDHFSDDGFHQHQCIDSAINWLRKRPRQNAKPLCFMVGTNWPHVPWPDSDETYRPDALKLPAGSLDTPKTREWRARYASAVTKADDDLGRLVATVREYLGPNTLTLFSADHGAQWPLAKWNLYESGVCVPLIVVWPKVIQAGSRSSALVQWTDLLPTLLDAAGGVAPPNIDGSSFLSVLQGLATQHREHLFTTHTNDGRMNVYPMRAVCNQRWKYIRNLHPDFAFTTHIDLPGKLGQRDFFSSWESAAQSDVAAAETLRRYHQRPAEELYDLSADPNEQRNLAESPSHQNEKSKLSATLDAWLNEQGDRLMVPEAPRLLTDPTSYGPKAVIVPSRPAVKATKP